MATLTQMKARIVSDFDDRTDLTASIATAISDAIRHYQRTRFHFNVLRSITFNTVAGQQNYGTSANSLIPSIYRIDTLYYTQNSMRWESDRTSIEDIELMADTSGLVGPPWYYAYFNREIWVYPTPDAVYAMRAIGHVKVAEPISDDDDQNDWMNEAYELILCRAKIYLATHKLNWATTQPAELQNLMGAERDALQTLQDELQSRNDDGAPISGSFC